MAYNKLTDAAPIQNKLTELSKSLTGIRNLIEERLAEIERVIKIDTYLRAGVLAPEEAKRLLARQDAQVVVNVLAEVAKNRGSPECAGQADFERFKAAQSDRGG